MSLLISSKNLLRHLIYKLYQIYKKHLQYKIHIYDLQTIEIINRLPVNAIAIDIGVNEGQILRYLNKRCIKGKIIGIEPIKELADFLDSKYNNERITIQQIALSDEHTESVFYFYAKRNAVSGLKHRDLKKSNDLVCTPVKVQVRKLDDIFKEARLDFVKIDVEGAEYNVLKGAQETLRKFHPVIVFESGRGGLEYFEHTVEELYALLSSMNYKISTLSNYNQSKEHFSREEFIGNFSKGYDFQYVAYF